MCAWWRVERMADSRRGSWGGVVWEGEVSLRATMGVFGLGERARRIEERGPLR